MIVPTSNINSFVSVYKDNINRIINSGNKQKIIFIFIIALNYFFMKHIKRNLSNDEVLYGEKGGRGAIF